MFINTTKYLCLLPIIHSKQRHTHNPLRTCKYALYSAQNDGGWWAWTGFSWFSPVLCQLGVIIYGYQ